MNEELKQLRLENHNLKLKVARLEMELDRNAREYSSTLERVMCERDELRRGRSE